MGWQAGAPGAHRRRRLARCGMCDLRLRAFQRGLRLAASALHRLRSRGGRVGGAARLGQLPAGRA
jgi:hypothetical protein